ncbi:unnamed protein product [Effrenium voratum]|uniref:Uncharacterized protein n=1 Tax=Effrenium voratum TaxID=2562239 RepID=A0AA36MRX9_9DINO|nr:unnamed protein product [Effrenium voratum]CAJ1377938.1 unnamed protein product [Effrenium voratum]CAJ1445083.1 unnamed protein product [Effrenium voratum]
MPPPPHGGAHASRIRPLPSVSKALSPEVCARAFFTTTSGDTMRNHFADASAQMARSSSFSSILQPPSRYHPSVGGMQRSMCTYNSTFQQKSLDAYGPTNELRELYKQQSRGSGSNAPKPPLSSVTTTKSSYPAYVEEAAAGAVAEIQRPAQAVHVDPSAKFLERSSVLHRDFRRFDARQMQRCHPEPAAPPHDAKMAPPLCPDRDSRFQGITQYRRDYGH